MRFEGSTRRSSLHGPSRELLHVPLGDADRGVRLHEQRGRGPCRGPGVAGRVEAIVDPGQRARSRVGVDCGQLPVASRRGRRLEPAAAPARRAAPSPSVPLAAPRPLAPARPLASARRSKRRNGSSGGRPSREGRCSLARSSQPLHQTSSKISPSASRCPAAAAERKCGMPSIEWKDPAGGVCGGKPKRETTPSMSTISSGGAVVCAAGFISGYGSRAGDGKGSRGGRAYRAELVRQALSTPPEMRPLATAEVATANLPESMRGSKALGERCRWSPASAYLTRTTNYDS